MPEVVDIDVDDSVVVKEEPKHDEKVNTMTVSSGFFYTSSQVKHITTYRVHADPDHNNVCECDDVFISLMLSSNVFVPCTEFDPVLVSLTPNLVKWLRKTAPFNKGIEKAMDFALSTYTQWGPLFVQVACTQT